MNRPIRHDVYRNLNKRKGDPSLFVWSLRVRGKVEGHSKFALLLNPEFKVSESTRQRVITRNRRAVCAFVRGTLAHTHPHSISRMAPAGKRVRISFNPYTGDTFYRCDTRKPVTAADAVIFTSEGCFAINPR
jgi:hypothetical protein